MEKTKNGLLVIISGCSGVGKDAIINRMKELKIPFFYAVTYTSRPRRAGERGGVDYHFVDQPTFEKMIQNDEFFEWANVYGNLYGVPKKTIKEALAQGKDVIVKVDVQGAATIKRIDPGAISIFIAPPSMEELRRRLTQRKTESGVDLERRLQTAQKEMESMPSFDHVVVSQNDGIDQAIAEIQNIIAAEKAHLRRPRFHEMPYHLFRDYVIANKRIFEIFNKANIEGIKGIRIGDEVFRIRTRPHHRGQIRRWSRRILRKLHLRRKHR